MTDEDLVPVLAAMWPCQLATCCLDSTSVGDATLEVLARQDRLTWIGAGGTAITDSGLIALATCRDLTSIEVDRCPGITHEGIDALARAKPDLEIRADCLS